MPWKYCSLSATETENRVARSRTFYITLKNTRCQILCNCLQVWGWWYCKWYIEFLFVCSQECFNLCKMRTMALRLAALMSINLLFKQGCCCAEWVLKTCFNLFSKYGTVRSVLAFRGKVLSSSPDRAKQHFRGVGFGKIYFPCYTIANGLLVW